MIDGRRKFILQYAFDQFGEPYVWGAKGEDQWDCSGLVVASLNHAILWDKVIRNAQGIYDFLSVNGECVKEADEVLAGDLVFYGKGVHSIIHVGICVGHGIMIGANGGKINGGEVNLRNITYHPLPVVAYIDPVKGWQLKQKGVVA